MSGSPDAFNPDLLDRIPLTARSVLDVGCGSGALALEYRRRNPAALLVGIERDARAAEVARRRMHHVLEGDLERDPLPFRGNLPPSGFDCIVYGDVLEHLHDPWTILAQHVQALSPEGTVLVCMPNVEHWSFVERLLRGTWTYEQQGLFDRTHLRWFSPDTTRRALVDAGLVPIDVAARTHDPEAAGGFVRAIAPGLRALGIEPEAYLRRAGALQHVWRARRRPVSRLAVVSTMLDPVGGVSEVRVVQPLQALSTDPSILAHVTPPGGEARLPEGIAEVYVMHRPALVGQGGLDALRALHARHRLIVCEFDDHPDFIPILQRPDVHNFTGAHAVQTSTEPLAEFLRAQNPEVAVFPNAVPRLPDPRNFARSDRLTLFFGGINREQDWPALLPALNAVAGMAGERLQFRIVADQGLFDALETPYKEFTPLCDYGTYMQLLATSEVCLMPLLDTPFNRCKSDLKFLEASACRVAALASPVVYADSIEDGRTGFIFRTPAELQQRLVRMLANPEATRAVADAARAFVAGNRMMAYQVARRVGWYRSLLARREALHEAVLARVPELRPKLRPVAAGAPG